MKIKKEYIILFSIIIVLALYIALRNNNRIQYDIPEIPGLDRENISGIEINTKAKSVSIRKEGNDWVIGKEKYLALSHMIEDMLDFLEKPVLITVVSDSKNYARYGLDDNSRLEVIASSDKGVLRSVKVGFVANGQMATFIKFENDHRVYSAKKDLREIFSMELEDIRDKKVITFDVDEIDSISLVRSGRKLKAVKKQVLEKTNEANDATKIVNEYVWQSDDGKELDEAVIMGLLREISSLRCLAYYYDKKKEDFGEPVSIIKIKGQKEYTLSVFSKEEGTGDYPVISSGNLSPLKISMWKIDNIIDKFDGLCGEKEEAKSAD